MQFLYLVMQWTLSITFGCIVASYIGMLIMDCVQPRRVEHTAGYVLYAILDLTAQIGFNILTACVVVGIVMFIVIAST